MKFSSSKKYITRVVLSFSCASLIWTSSILGVWAATKEDTLADQLAKPIQTNSIANWPTGPAVYADSAILMDADTGAILYAKDIHAKQFPASTTKILTCLLATELCSMDEIVTFSTSAVFGIPRDSSHIAMDVGQELTMEQCLNAILIRSANEVSFAVGEHISGTWQDFATLMNERATQLGCLNSNFVNPNGLPDDNHYTTAYDLATIARAFFSNELLCKISSTKKLHIPASDKLPVEKVEYSSNQLFPGGKYAYSYLVGSKTGYTTVARNSLVTCAEKDGMKLICVVLRDENPYHYEDTLALFNYGFSNFDNVNISQVETKYNIDNTNFVYGSVDIFGSSKPILSLNNEASLSLPKTASFDDIVSTLSYDTDNEEQVAIITYTYQGQFVGSASVDLATDPAPTYVFDSELQQGSHLSSGSDTTPKAEKVIFVDVIKVILWIIGIAAAIIAAIFIYQFMGNVQFPTRDRSNRRIWKRHRRKKIRRVKPVAQKKRPKRPSRFRDFDF